MIYGNISICDEDESHGTNDNMEEISIEKLIEFLKELEMNMGIKGNSVGIHLAINKYSEGKKRVF